MKKLWVRLGANLYLIDAEAETLLGDSNAKEREEIIRDIIYKKLFEIDGECYAPTESIVNFNEMYGTEFEVCDYEFFW